MLSPDFYDYLIKIILSILLGGLIGVEREISHHWAGLRTHILVCLGATLIMFVTGFQYLNPQSGVNINIDATRLAAGVITGIGFLGAGVIFKEGANVKGLTTAASIWVTASVGILVGVAMYELAVIATICIMIVLYSDMFIERYLIREHRLWSLNLTIYDKPKGQLEVESIIKSKKIEIHLKDFKRRDNIVTLVYMATLPKNYQKESLTRGLLTNQDILGVEWSKE
jgi:putative Mg2+ transporter-C (MgtC) family protein